MAMCSCVLPLVNPKACEDCPNRSEPFDFIPSTEFYKRVEDLTSLPNLTKGANDNTK